MRRELKTDETKLIILVPAADGVLKNLPCPMSISARSVSRVGMGRQFERD